MIDVSKLTIDEIKALYPVVSRYDAEAAKATGAKTMADLFRVQSEMFERLNREDKMFVRRDLVEIEQALSDAAATLGRKGGAAGRGAAKRRPVDYAVLGRKGGRPGPSLAAQAAVVWTELSSSTTRKMSLGPRLVTCMLAQCEYSRIGLTPDSAARLIRERAGKRTSAWITATARKLGEP